MLLALVAALLVTACGGGDDALSTGEYEAELRTTMDELETAYGDVVGTDGRTSTPLDVDVLRARQVALRDAGDRLAAIEPPAELADEHADLVAGVRDIGDDVDLLVQATEALPADPARARALTAQFGAAAEQSFAVVGDAAARLDRAGVDAGL